MVGPDLSGTVLDGRYRLVSLLGMGGMGEVYRGVHLSLDRTVAIKILPAQLSQDPRFRARFAREARAASKIAHRNVVQIIDYGESPSGPVYFVMEFLEGRDLGALLREEGRLPWPRARSLLLQAVGALAAAHAYGIIHRDIKPGNCFVLDLPHEGLTDVVKLLDFGIAKVLTEGEGKTPVKHLTGTGEIVGTASYMAPEQARGEPLDPRSDVYSLGIMAYEMLTGRLPFVGANPIHVVTRHLYDRPEPLHVAVPDILPEVEALVLRAIAKDPGDRFESMAELQAAILAVRDVSMDSVRMRALTAARTAARAESGQLARASGMRDEATVVLREPEARALHEAREDAFEDAVTPYSPVLRPRFGEPFPLRQAADDESPIAWPEDDEELDEPTRKHDIDRSEVQPTARVRLVPDPEPGVVGGPLSLDEITVTVSPAAREPIHELQAASGEIEALVDDPPSLAVDVSITSAPTSLRTPPLDARGEQSDHRRRTKGWHRLLGLVLVLGGGAGTTYLALAERQQGSSTATTSDDVHETDVPTPSPEVQVTASPPRTQAAMPAGRDSESAKGSPVKSAKTHEATGMTDPPSAGSRAEAEKPVLASKNTPSLPDPVTRAAIATPPPPKPKDKQSAATTCEERRNRVDAADEAGRHDRVIELTARLDCWPGSLRAVGVCQRQDALINKGRYQECVEVGQGVDDQYVRDRTAKCQALLLTQSKLMKPE